MIYKQRTSLAWHKRLWLTVSQICKFQHLPLIVIVSDSSSSVVVLQTAVRPWLRRRDARQESVDRESELIMAVRAASLLYNGVACMARLSYLTSCGASVCFALSPRIPIVWALLTSTHSHRLVFFERTRDNSRVSDPTRSVQAVQCR